MDNTTTQFHRCKRSRKRPFNLRPRKPPLGNPRPRSAPWNGNHYGTKPLSPRGGGRGGYTVPPPGETLLPVTVTPSVAGITYCHRITMAHNLLMHLNGTPVLDMRTGYQKTTDLAKMPIEIIISTGRYACFGSQKDQEVPPFFFFFFFFFSPNLSSGWQR